MINIDVCTIIENNKILYNCLDCNFNCNKKGNLKRHLLTSKHIKKQSTIVEDTKTCACGKRYLQAEQDIL